jgi:hypothetical protein
MIPIRRKDAAMQIDTPVPRTGAAAEVSVVLVDDDGKKGSDVNEDEEEDDDGAPVAEVVEASVLSSVAKVVVAI